MFIYKKIITYITAAMAAGAAFGVSVEANSGTLWVPYKNGNFSNVNIGAQAKVFFCLVDENTYLAYKDDSQGLYAAWDSGDFDSAKYQKFAATTSYGELEVDLGYNEVNASDIFYLLSVATYDSTEYGRSYYIARVLSQNYIASEGTDFDIVYFTKAVSGAGTWNVVPEPSAVSLIAFGLVFSSLKRKVS